ncbi:NAD-P-binding protein [Epithele typhae]|uniref:NAD-P-binding protein n=1 Tax=Epithele typhae TaxID=378194 RepID=UPI002007D4B1|nr:NAD-P-binding protein [Epithele typhae]KAH9931610.1 NAD-P-binding protein [Epithele typhae]
MSIPQTTREYRLPKKEGFHDLTLVESPIPKLKATEVLLKVHAVSLNFRDVAIAKNIYPMPLKENLVPGSDMAGDIVALGPEVTGWSVGERVSVNFAPDHIFGEASEETINSIMGGYSDGVLTEYKAVPAHSLVRIPEHLSYEEASTLPCAGVTAYNALFGANPIKGSDIVLVQGTGGVSIFALQIAVASGAVVIATSSSDKKLELVKKLGATHTINYKTTPDWEIEVRKLTNGRGVDHVIEVGGAGTIIKSVQSVRFGGSIDLIGLVAGQADVSMLPLLILKSGCFVHGIQVGPRVMFEDMNRLISAAKIKPVIDKVFPFEQLKESYEYLWSQQHVGKVVVTMSKD